MLKSSLYDYSNEYIVVKGLIAITWRRADVAAQEADERNKGVMLNILHHSLTA